MNTATASCREDYVWVNLWKLYATKHFCQTDKQIVTRQLVPAEGALSIWPHHKVPAVLQPLPLFEIQMKEQGFLCALLEVSVSYVTISLCMHMLC